ncbi:MAG TPA: DUF4349 domain-containing protein [Mycobacteriales bacterium]|nr:DUF4349 domain-containing protein [Mycobacteriales bacterium]
MRLGHRTRVALIGSCAVLVALIAIAFAVGGSGSGSGSGTVSESLRPAAGVAPAPSAPTFAKLPAHGSATQDSPTLAAPEVAVAPGLPAARANGIGVGGGSGASASAASGTVSSGGGASGGAADVLSSTGSSIDATRIVKTGNLTIRVPKTQVQTKSDDLVALATTEGGYVSQSSTNLGNGTPYGEVVLRIPVAHFEDAIAKAQRLGHVVTITRSADDVTGKYVDLAAKKHALERTRATYLSILSRARTIGATLSVQERIDQVQQQIDQLHGQLKLLGNQSSYSTLTVDLVPSGATPLAATSHHQRHGIGKAWHDSWSRFGRGVDAIVGAIGPIVFAILLLGVVAALGLLGNRAARRMLGSSGTAAAK